MPKTIVVLPAYNAAKTLTQTVKDIPIEYVDEIILVDDCSNDKTIEVAKQLGIIIEKHNFNKGYGANQKTCYNIALKHNADIIVMLHPDYQYDPKLIKYFVEFIRDGYFNVMLGSRIRSKKEALAGGMPKYKYFFNRSLSLLENIITGQNLSEWHTGMRAYSRDVLEKIDYMKLSDDFVFDSQILFNIVKNDFKIGDIPVPVRYFKEASSINFKRSVKYGLQTLNEMLKFIFGK